MHTHAMESTAGLSAPQTCLPSGHARDLLFRAAAGGLAFLGMGMCFYLAAVAIGRFELAGCLSEPCSAPLLSGEWGRWWGMPLSLLGIPLNLTVIVALLFAGPDAPVAPRRISWSILIAAAFTFVLAAAWLVGMQVYLRSPCGHCLAVHSLGTVTAYLLLMHAPVGRQNSSLIRPARAAAMMLLAMAGLGVLIVGQWIHHQRFQQWAESESRLSAPAAAVGEHSHEPASEGGTVVALASGAQASRPLGPCALRFLRENARRPEVKLAPSGLQYEILRSGAGVSAADSDAVVVHCRGVFLEGGVFVDTFAAGQPLTLAVGRQFVGLRQTLGMMKVGAQWRVAIPSHLIDPAFEHFDKIKAPDPVLIYDLELLAIRPDPLSALSPVP